MTGTGFNKWFSSLNAYVQAGIVMVGFVVLFVGVIVWITAITLYPAVVGIPTVALIFVVIYGVLVKEIKANKERD